MPDVLHNGTPEEIEVAHISRLFSSSRDLVAVVDTKGAFWYTNPAFGEVLGYCVDDLESQSFFDLVHPDDRASALTELGKLFAGHPSASLEAMFRRADGTYSWLAWTMTHVANEKLILALARDTTNERETRSKQHHEIEKARGEANAILDAASDAMVLISTDGTILSLNAQFIHVFFAGNPSDIIGRNFADLDGEIRRIFANPDAVAHILNAALNDPNSSVRAMFEQMWPERRNLELVSAPVRSSVGSLLGRLFTFRDVTYHREVNRMKTEFVSMVSHELRTPLTSISGYVDLLLDGEVGDLTGEQLGFLSIVKGNTKRMVALVSNLLDVSRIESGGMDLTRAAVDLDAAVWDVHEKLLPQLKAKEQHFTVDLIDGLPAVWVDSDRLTQILANLLSNASKYTPIGGRIVLKARARTDALHVTISDTGIGMNDEEIARLFTKFYQARNHASLEISGTGLGLFITKALLEIQGGQISVVSAPGAGSTFTFTLPLALPMNLGRGDVA